MAQTAVLNDQIPTDPITFLALMTAILWAASQLTPDQAQALASTGGIAELALLFMRVARERR